MLNFTKNTILKDIPVFFEPWIGDNYDPNGKEKNIMVLGHSYPCNENITKICPKCGIKPRKEECTQTTIDSIHEYLDNALESNQASTFQAFEKALCGSEDISLWSRVCFLIMFKKHLLKEKMVKS